MNKGTKKAEEKREMKLWDKGYELDRQIEKYTVGDDYLLDRKLVKYDCLASIAHAKMLAKIGVLSKKECADLVKMLEEIIGLDKKGAFAIAPADEDCHTAIEAYLTKKLGDAGKKIHTGRSRNDQVLVALHLYYLDYFKKLKSKLVSFQKVLSAFRNKQGNFAMPGYTHMRKAMPSSAGLWTQCFIDAVEDDLLLLESVTQLIDQCPLGTGAGYGVPMAIDREYTASELGFSRVLKNPLYAQHSRGKFSVAILHLLSSIMLDLNKMASDLILFSMPEFGFFELPEKFCTGSSLMPQKKNPDVLELVRAHYHAVLSHEFQVQGMCANLISGYNRDMQLSKEAVMKGFEVTLASVAVMTLVVEELVVNKERCAQAMSDELYATEKALRMAEKGVPFRDAYRKVAEEFKRP